MNSASRVLAVAIVSLFLAACGDKKPEAPAAPTAAPAAPAATAPAEPAAPAPAPDAAAAPAAAVPVADAALGKSVYGKTCALCHAAGIAGAAPASNKDEWGPRIAQGKETLYKHAMEGFTGSKGAMPARGGNAKLTDEEVKAAVDFMADQSAQRKASMQTARLLPGP
ncbi:MAG: cytochrome c5 family protein [Simplicispira sp.]|nr:cytochrome c5 family protein [Simplicispira sp.]